jgi:prolyl-tRNA synthetase
MAMPVIKGEKASFERFPGADNTYTIEAMMQDRKALQSGTSHFLGQNFAKAMEIKFQNEKGETATAWTTSWGVSTRLIGGLIMTHSDDDGLVCPPRLAPKHVVIIPIYRNDEERAKVLAYCKKLQADLAKTLYDGEKIRVLLDDRDIRGGEKVWGHIKKGVPVRVEVGPRDMDQNAVFVAQRNKGHKDKQAVPRDQFVETLPQILQSIQDDLYQKALAYRDANMKKVDSLDELKKWFTPKNEDKPEIHGGFALCHVADDPAIGTTLKEMKLTHRCTPLDAPKDPGACIFTGKPVERRSIIAKSY